MNARLFFGVEVKSGNALSLEAPETQLAAWASSDSLPDENRLKRLDERARQNDRGLPYGINPHDPTDAGWGIVFGAAEDSAVRDALMPLFRHRQSQFTGPKKREKRCRILEYRGESTAQKWLVSQGVDAGNVDPRKVPYYLLVIGTPDRIPFAFTQDLAVEYRVGRLSFNTATEYAQYVDNLIRLETSDKRQPRRAAFFATRHDPATTLSADRLVKPLLDGSGEDQSVCIEAGFEEARLIEDDANAEDLSDLLADDSRRPSFLFTASHGAEFARDDADQRSRQGSLICQSWPGAKSEAASHLFEARDLPDPKLNGMVAFLFACHSGGTPQYDAVFRDRMTGTATEIAPSPFSGALAQRLLLGGAAGVIGHVDRALGRSLLNPLGKQQLIPYRNLCLRIMGGLPLAVALQDLNERYAALSVQLGSLRDLRRVGAEVPDEELVSTWLARNDSGGYILLGDPATRLRV